MTYGNSDGQAEDERIQINVTLKRRTIDSIREAFPEALDDSERIRLAVSGAIERHNASEYTIRR